MDTDALAFPARAGTDDDGPMLDVPDTVEEATGGDGGAAMLTRLDRRLNALLTLLEAGPKGETERRLGELLKRMARVEDELARGSESSRQANERVETLTGAVRELRTSADPTPIAAAVRAALDEVRELVTSQDTRDGIDRRLRGIDERVEGVAAGLRDELQRLVGAVAAQDQLAARVEDVGREVTSIADALEAHRTALAGRHEGLERRVDELGASLETTTRSVEQVVERALTDAVAEAAIRFVEALGLQAEVDGADADGTAIDQAASLLDERLSGIEAGLASTTETLAALQALVTGAAERGDRTDDVVASKVESVLARVERLEYGVNAALEAAQTASTTGAAAAADAAVASMRADVRAEVRAEMGALIARFDAATAPGAVDPLADAVERRMSEIAEEVEAIRHTVRATAETEALNRNAATHELRTRLDELAAAVAAVSQNSGVTDRVHALAAAIDNLSSRLTDAQDRAAYQGQSTAESLASLRAMVDDVQSRLAVVAAPTDPTPAFVTAVGTLVPDIQAATAAAAETGERLAELDRRMAGFASTLSSIPTAEEAISAVARLEGRLNAEVGALTARVAHLGNAVAGLSQAMAEAMAADGQIPSDESVVRLAEAIYRVNQAARATAEE